MLIDTEPRKGMSFFYSKLPDRRGRDGAMGRREVIKSPWGVLASSTRHRF